MEIQEKRLSKRLTTNLPVTFEHLGGQRHIGETTTKDISTTGLRINMPGFFPTNSSFLIKLHFPEINKIVEGLARVAWSLHLSHSDQYQAGMQFYEINPVFKKWLEEYIGFKEAIAS